jgi:hypothetical protein
VREGRWRAMLQAALCQLVLGGAARRPLAIVYGERERIVHAGGSLQVAKVDEALEVDGAAFREVVGLYSSFFSGSYRVHSSQQHDSNLV